MSELGVAFDSQIKGENRMEKIENLRDRLSNEEIQTMAENGSEVAQDALTASNQNFLGNREAKEIVEDEEAWQESPAEALSALEEVLESRDPDLDALGLDERPTPLARSDLFKDLVKQGHVEKAKEYIDLMESYTSRTEKTSSTMEDVEEIYQEALGEDEPERALKIAETFDVGDKEKPVRKMISKKNDKGQYFGEALLRKRHDLMYSRPAEELYQHFMNEEDFENAAWVLKTAKKQESMPSEYSEDDIKEAAEKAFEAKREEGNYKDAVDVATEYSLQNDEALKDTLMIGAASGQISEAYLDRISDDRGYDLSPPEIEEEEEESVDKEEEETYDNDRDEPSLEEEQSSSEEGFLGSIRKYVP